MQISAFLLYWLESMEIKDGWLKLIANGKGQFQLKSYAVISCALSKAIKASMLKLE
jgi:hypothetical protein